VTSQYSVTRLWELFQGAAGGAALRGVRIHENRRDISSVEGNWPLNGLKPRATVIIYRVKERERKREGERQRGTRCARLNELFKKFMRVLKLP